MPCESEFIAKLTIYKCVSFPFRVWHFALLIKRTDIMQKPFIKDRRKLFLPKLYKAVTHFESGKHLFYSIWVRDEYVQDFPTPKCLMRKLLYILTFNCCESFLHFSDWTSMTCFHRIHFGNINGLSMWPLCGF